ncbi:alpha-1,6-mannosyl-glycoprotein 4-beta-N-acetylglucosaminyltransferase-like [Branchiostoma floridae]|uniref:Alpha-1,6-mannosyl-glycoprotein 4-beta-N-acetylglucosaminyltransferase-like n=1 Tax=Branchiostoma floridae TaxID=7739 RepID=A0A9J7MM18_BRAFL|nr:alpha-1,6-mannosyl-glycoprotein 4-beta-N-acetylglucosaminyltransferase-like [Branchiostoma floridae]
MSHPGNRLPSEALRSDYESASEVQPRELQREMLIEPVGIVHVNETLHRREAGMERSTKQVENTSTTTTHPLSTSGRPTHAVTDSVLIAGRPRQNKAFLTIGIPTVKRDQDATYLFATLDSLIEHTDAEQHTQIVIVVFLADFDTLYNRNFSSEISRKYSQHLESGFMRVIQAPRTFYPTLEGLKVKFNDSKERVRWRSKQCVDFAFLFQYCQNLSQYYMQLEDDVVSAENFFSGIQRYLNRMKYEHWTMLEFSELGFIGKLFRSSDLQLLADFFLLFYQELPADLLLRAFVRITQPYEWRFLHRPSLFQHVGVHSSLDGKIQTLRDRAFGKPIADGKKGKDLLEWKKKIVERMRQV